MTTLFAVADDPFKLLNLQPDPSLDKKTIKRAYKRMALKYHPDVVTNQSSTAEEKRQASDYFAKINWAYATLSGKGDGADASSQTSSKSSTAGGYTPPHRRTSSYYSSNNKQRTTAGTSTDWRDYMPKYEEEDAKYDADGDSFGSIFSDLIMGAAGAAAGGGGGGGILKDFVEFLERNVDGYDSNGDGDAQLKILLQTGSFEEIAEEMDDTELVVQQLSSKADDIAKELIMVEADVKVASRYIEKIDLEEKMAELEAREKIVAGYLKKARKRLIKLQTRYKELIVGGENDVKGRSGRRTSAGPSPSPQSSERDNTRTSRQSPETNVSDRDSKSEDSGEDAWKREGFGSYGRGRGSSSSRRRRGGSSSRRETTSEPQQASTQQTARPSSSSSSSSSANSSRNAGATSGSGRTASAGSSRSPSSTSTPKPWTPPVPPHRRTSSAASQALEDKRRLRELKVEDEFEKLKKDLGL